MGPATKSAPTPPPILSFPLIWLPPSFGASASTTSWKTAIKPTANIDWRKASRYTECFTEQTADKRCDMTRQSIDRLGIMSYGLLLFGFINGWVRKDLSYPIDIE